MPRARIALLLLSCSLLTAISGSDHTSSGNPTEEQPFQLTVTSEILLPTHKLVRQDNYLYILGYPNGFHILDLSDPAYPRWAGVESETAGFSMNVWGDYAYVTGGSNVLKILDISDPTNPWLATTYSDFETYLGFYPYTGYVAASNDVLFVELVYLVDECYEGERIAVMDVSDPAHPQRIGTLDVRNTSPMHANGNVLYTTTGAFLRGLYISGREDRLPVKEARRRVNLVRGCGK